MARGRNKIVALINSLNNLYAETEDLTEEEIEERINTIIQTEQQG